MTGKRLRLSVAVTLTAALIHLLGNEAHAIRISIHNNLSSAQGEGGETLEVEEATSVEAPKNKVRFSIAPGETKELTGGNVTYFILNRVFVRHKLRYEIECDADSTGEAILSLQDIHEENLPPACRITRRGHWSKRSGMNWDE